MLPWACPPGRRLRLLHRVLPRICCFKIARSWLEWLPGEESIYYIVWFYEFCCKRFDPYLKSCALPVRSWATKHSPIIRTNRRGIHDNRYRFKITRRIQVPRARAPAVAMRARAAAAHEEVNAKGKSSEPFVFRGFSVITWLKMVPGI